MLALLLLLLLSSACGRTEEKPARQIESHLEPSAPPPEERRPLKEGFTQRPPRDTPGLPPPIEPLVVGKPDASPAERARAQQELLSRLDALADSSAVLPEIQSKARDGVRDGRLPYVRAEALFREFLFPNDEKAAEARYVGKLVVLTGSVAPHNMTDLADGFKLVEQTPYVQEPVLLATEYELSFVRCHLARPEMQPLRDWQDVHLVGVVEGKLRGDLVLKRCVVL
jgi:hypothetical protein